MSIPQRCVVKTDLLLNILIKVLKLLLCTHTTHIYMLDTMELNRTREMFVNPDMNMLIFSNVNSDKVVGSSNYLSLKMGSLEGRRFLTKRSHNITLNLINQSLYLRNGLLLIPCPTTENHFYILSLVEVNQAILA